MKIHPSCEIEYFDETHLCKLCVILRSRVLRVVCISQRVLDNYTHLGCFEKSFLRTAVQSYGDGGLSVGNGAVVVRMVRC